MMSDFFCKGYSSCDTQCEDCALIDAADHAAELAAMRELNRLRIEVTELRTKLEESERRGMKQAEPVIYGIDWGRNSDDRTAVSVFKLLPDGTRELIACEYQRAEYETQAFSVPSSTVQVAELAELREQLTCAERESTERWTQICALQNDFEAMHDRAEQAERKLAEAEHKLKRIRAAAGTKERPDV